MAGKRKMSPEGAELLKGRRADEGGAEGACLHA